MSKCRLQPCETCPYRRDVASGVWAAHEYAKLPDYDKPTGEQPIAAFYCHTSPDFLCNGWAICHQSRGHAFQLLALRFAVLFDSEPIVIPAPVLPLFKSGAEAARHGMKQIERPTRRAASAIRKIEAVRSRKAGRKGSVK